MKLLKIINVMTQSEISRFYNILTAIISEIDESISLEKSTDAEDFVKTFNSPEINNKYQLELKKSLQNDVFLDILSDIIVRDGNCMMSRDWLKVLAEKEIKSIKERMKFFQEILESKNRDIETKRIRDYRIFLNCTKTAFDNDLSAGNEARISAGECTILFTLKNELGLSNDEYRTLLYLAIGNCELEKLDIDESIRKLRDNGIAFFKRSSQNIYIPDEIINMLREIKGINLAEKFTRRIIKCLDDRQINKIKKNHGIKEIERYEKIESIIKKGVSVRKILSDEIFDEDTKENEKKKILFDIIDNKLEIHLTSYGKTVDERIDHLLTYFKKLNEDTNIGISRDGFERMLQDLKKLKNVEKLVRTEFEIEPKVELTSETLLDYNILPKDILYLIPLDDLKSFCNDRKISYRGKNIINCILSSYRESENIYIENYVLIANNDINSLKNNGIDIKSKDVGSVFENTTKAIFKRLSLNVNEELKKRINTKRDKADIILDLGNQEIIIIECKSSKKDYSKFSSVIRQIKSYAQEYSRNGFKIKGVIIVSGCFTDDFIRECDTFYDLNVTLIEAQTLLNIYEEFKQSKLNVFPVTLFRHGLLQEDVIVKVLKK
ncbi:MAG: hypothetical protein MUP34_02145 [Candidatus Atribacteria bacterium]|nr:hypothetical protein [Candidatus Atribacteria bacterium]